MIWKIRKVVDSTFLFLLVFTKLELIKGTVSVISNDLPSKVVDGTFLFLLVFTKLELIKGTVSKAGKAYKLMKHKSDQKCGR